MNKLIGIFVIFFAVTFTVTTHTENFKKEKIDDLIKDELLYVTETYKALHRNPELSRREFSTAKRLAKELRLAGFRVEENFGGIGIVGVLRNGEGPVGYFRTELDALPVQEQSGWSFSSHIAGISHACGHDIHIASMVGYARILSKIKNRWKGTLVFIGQPAEETGHGAKAMLDAGLYSKYGNPNYVVAFHVGGMFSVGQLKYFSKTAMAALSFFDIDLEGVGGHGSMPEKAVNPIQMSSFLSQNLDEAYSSFNSNEKFVYALGGIKSGTKHNIIPQKAKIMGNLRGLNNQDMDFFKEKIKTALVETARKYNVSTEKQKIIFSGNFPVTINNEQLINRLIPVFQSVFGENIEEINPLMASEDFSHYSLNGKVPTAYFFIGAKPKNPPKNWGINHSPFFAPDYKNIFPLSLKVMTKIVLKLHSKID